MYWSTVLSYTVKRGKKTCQESHGMSILLGLFEPVFDMMTDAPGMLGCVSPIKVDSQLVKGNILYLEVAPFPEVIP